MSLNEREFINNTILRECFIDPSNEQEIISLKEEIKLIKQTLNQFTEWCQKENDHDKNIVQILENIFKVLKGV